jgi:hypothetical protein
MRWGRTPAVVAATAVAASLAFATIAHGAVIIGETFVPNLPKGGAPGTTALQTSSPGNQYTVPTPGVLTTWNFQASGTPPPSVKFKAGRPAGGNSFTILGESAPRAPAANTINTYSDIRISVQPGDVIGMLGPPTGDTARNAPGYGAHAVDADVPPGTTTAMTPVPATIQFPISAVLEPDCDSDGFGDESQDDNIASCPPAPTTAITKAPKDKIKTKKRKKKVTYEFSASESGATFNCVLDGKQEFKACTSPLTVKVKKGKHTFSVEATDAGGNKGAAATDSFKVKRKKKK